MLAALRDITVRVAVQPIFKWEKLRIVSDSSLTSSSAFMHVHRFCFVAVAVVFTVDPSRSFERSEATAVP